jgi:ceramide glucosyltransferase
MLGWLLLGVRALLGLCLLGYGFYAALSIWAARKWRLQAPAANADWSPGVTILKPVRGVDAEAWENFVSFCLLDYPKNRLQILFGALDSEDPAIELARKLQSLYPQIDIGIITRSDAGPTGNNRKVCNLLSMLPHAKHDLLALCDSDMRVRPDYVRRIVAPFAPKEPAYRSNQSEIIPNLKSVGLVTCPYRGTCVQSFAAILEALGIGSDFIPSALVSAALEGASFAFGSTIVIPRAVLDEIGGFEPLLDELADDYRLGNGVHRAGYRVVLSDYVIEDVLGAEQFGPMWSRRLRWARTVRACRPGGYAGAFITYGTALGGLFLASTGFGPIGWGVFAATLLVRFGSALWISTRYTGDRAILTFLPLLPISDLLCAALYVTSYLGNHIEWRGERFRLLAGGRLERIE